MEQVVLFFVAIGIVIIGYVLYTTLLTRQKDRTDRDPDYTAALEALVRSEEERAKSFLIESAKKHPSSLSPFLVLGDLFRRQGALKKAEKIHHELSIRPNLKREEIEKIYESLALDYLEMGKYEQAIQASRKLLSLKKKDDRLTLETMLRAYEGLGDWNHAIETAKTISGRLPGDGTRFLARYHVYVGWKLQGTDPERAEGLFKKALSLDSDCLFASLFMGDLYFRDGEYDKAIDIWIEMLNRRPRTIHQIAERLERAYFESGKYSQIIHVYEQLHKRSPRDTLLLLGMARMSLKKGEYQLALRYAEESREIDPGDPRIYQVFLEIHEESGDPKPALETCRQYMNSVISSTNVFACGDCGYQDKSIFPRCPKCGNWELEFAT